MSLAVGKYEGDGRHSVASNARMEERVSDKTGVKRLDRYKYDLAHRLVSFRHCKKF
jgi:hypothetical protein